MKNTFWALLLAAGVVMSASAVQATLAPPGTSQRAEPVAADGLPAEAVGDSATPAAASSGFVELGDFEATLAPIFVDIPFRPELPQESGAVSDLSMFSSGFELTEVSFALPVAVVGAPEPGPLALLCAALCGLALLGSGLAPRPRRLYAILPKPRSWRRCAR